MKKIIFLSGMNGGKRDMFLIKKILKEFEVIHFPYDTSLKETVEQTAEKLKRFIDKLKLNKKEKISLIGLSAGGIISEYYLKFLDSKKVDKIVTICSPFRGTWIHILYSKKRKALQQGKFDSCFLKKVRSKKLIGIKERNFYCFLDPIVPGISGRGDNPKHTFFFLHALIQFWPPLIHKIRKFMLE